MLAHHGGVFGRKKYCDDNKTAKKLNCATKVWHFPMPNFQL